MNTAIIVMTILGCGHGETACEFIRTADTVWTSESACLAESETYLKQASDADYPDIVAVCAPKHPEPEQAVAQWPSAPQPDLAIREATMLELIADSMPDLADLEAAATGVAEGARSAMQRVSGWLPR